jgi:hypothetical protein
VNAMEAIRVARACGARLSTEGMSLVLEADSPPSSSVVDALRTHKGEVLELLRGERWAIIKWINDHFESSPPGVCGHCLGGSRPADPFVTLFVGEDRADIHASCYLPWLAEKEAQAQIALATSAA